MNRLLSLSAEDFQKSIERLRNHDIRALVQLIQREMQLEQDEFDRISVLLASDSHSPGSAEHTRLTNAQNDSQSRLEILMRKSKICLEKTSSETTLQEDRNSSPRWTTSGERRFSSDATQRGHVNQPSRNSNEDTRSSTVAQESIQFRSKTDESSAGSRLNSNSSPTTQSSVPSNRAPARFSTPVITASNKVSPSGALRRTSETGSRNTSKDLRHSTGPALVSEVVLRRVRVDEDVAPASPKVPVVEEEKLVDEESRDPRLLIANFERLSGASSDVRQSTPRPFVARSVVSRRSEADISPRRSVGSIEISTGPIKTGSGIQPVTQNGRDTKRTPLGRPDGSSSLMGQAGDGHGTYENSINNNGSRIVSEAITESEKNEVEKIVLPATLSSWNPDLLLDRLYRVKIATDKDSSVCPNGQTISGYLEKLPDQKTKGTILKTWKRRFFQAEQGLLKHYDDAESKDVHGVLQLAGSKVEDLGENMIGINDGRGHYLTLRCSNATDLQRWMPALASHTAEREHLDYLRPVPLPLKPHKDRRVVIVDLGSCSVRAGLLREKPCLPDLFFPHMAALDKAGRVEAVGKDVFKPSVRANCELVHPMKADTTLENMAFDKGIVKAVFEKIFKDLEIDCKKYTVFLSLPPNVANATRSRLAEVLIGDNGLGCASVSMCGQALLALHAYGEPTGVLVDVGYRTEVLPVTDGIVQMGGVSRQIYGGHLIQDAFTQRLPHRLNSPTELLLARYAMEETAYVTVDGDIPDNEVTVNLSPFRLPSDFEKRLTVGRGRMQCTEGIFSPGRFGLDVPSLPKLVHSAVQSCPMDFRRTLLRSIFLSGATSLIPGLAERLQSELTELVPSSCVVRVHTAPNREHASFLGAGLVAASDRFSVTCVPANEWIASKGDTRHRALARWHM